MSRLEAFVSRHPVASYLTLTFAISWGGALMAIGGAGGMRGTTPGSDPRFVYALIAMLAGPSTAGLLLTALVHGREGLGELRARLTTRRVRVVWYAAALLTAPILMMTTLLVLSSISPAFRPGVFTSERTGPLLLAGLGVGLAAGIVEELGWTGFAIPAVRARHGVAATGAIVGVWWSAWHLLPNVWSSRAASGDLGVSLYLATTVVGVFIGYLTAFRMLMVWVYEHTQSVLIGMLMHASFTASLLILSPLAITGTRLVGYSFALAGALWGLVAVVALADRARRRASPDRRLAA